MKFRLKIERNRGYCIFLKKGGGRYMMRVGKATHKEIFFADSGYFVSIFQI